MFSIFEVAKGSGIKYRYKIPSKELKAMLGSRSFDKSRKVEVGDETGFCKAYDSIKEAVKDVEYLILPLSNTQ